MQKNVVLVNVDKLEKILKSIITKDNVLIYQAYITYVINVSDNMHITIPKGNNENV